MRGHITQRSKGSWSIVIDAGKDPETGKRRQQWHTVKGTKRNAQRILHEILVSMEKGTYVKPNHLTLGDWLEQWLNRLRGYRCLALRLSRRSSALFSLSTASSLALASTSTVMSIPSQSDGTSRRSM